MTFKILSWNPKWRQFEENTLEQKLQNIPTFRRIHNNSGSPFREPDRKTAHIPSPAVSSCVLSNVSPAFKNWLKNFLSGLGTGYRPLQKRWSLLEGRGEIWRLYFLGVATILTLKKCLYCIIKINNTIKVYGKNRNQTEIETNGARYGSIFVTFHDRKIEFCTDAPSLSNWLLFWS